MTPDQAALGFLFLKCFAGCLAVTIIICQLPESNRNSDSFDIGGFCIILSMLAMEVVWIAFLASLIPRTLQLGILAVLTIAIGGLVISRLMESFFKSTPPMAA